MQFEAARLENIATLVGGGGDGVPGNSGKLDEDR
jgi:hypothetical protein